ncbi:MAG: DNA polymerase III subunit delta [Lachnospiraceae bacterium]|jgi:DNA polymerase-3 subunit delta|nr:DNA polymerase III subunit delta [Lachnospiraceae bacterium]
MRTIDEQLKSGNLKPAYLLYGDEDYLKQLYRKRLLSATVKDGDTMNYMTFEGSGINEHEIIDFADTMPFFADWRVVYVENSGFFNRSVDDLADYFSKMSETAFLVFVESKIDKRSRTYKEFAKVGEVVELNFPEEKELQAWVGGRVKRAGKQITMDAWEEFRNRCSTNMENMDRELEKLLDYCADKPAISRQDVREICIDSSEERMFILVDGIGEKNPRKAMLAYQDMLEHKVAPLYILVSLEGQFRSILQTKSYLEQGMKKNEIQKVMGLRYNFFVDKYQKMAKNFSTGQLERILIECASTDEQVKSGKLDASVGVEMLLLKYSK